VYAVGPKSGAAMVSNTLDTQYKLSLLVIREDNIGQNSSLTVKTDEK